MMLRSMFPVGCALSLCGVLITLAGAPSASGRTLHSNELWGKFGGTVFDERQCDPIDNCELEKSCDEEDPGFACRAFGRDDETPAGSPNDEGCNFTGDENDMCEELGTTVCRERYRCKTENLVCVRDTSESPTEEDAPESCDNI